MYNAKTSFNYYLDNTILPLLPEGTYLYTKHQIFSYPCVFVKYPLVKDSQVDQIEAWLVQLEVLTNNNDYKTCDQLVNDLREKLKVKSGNGNTAILYDCNDPDNLEEIGNIKWTLASKPRLLVSQKYPEVVRYMFELNLEYVR